jgi:uncharacterized membrane protein
MMGTWKSLLLIPGFVLTFLLAAPAANAPTLSFKFSPVKVGKLTTEAWGVNNAGVMVGDYQDKPGDMHGFMLNGTKVTRINHPQGSNTVCVHINSNNAIVGYYGTSKGEKGFVYRKGKFTNIPGPAGALGSQANGINDKGWIVGGYTTSSGSSQGFLLKGKTYKTLNVPGATATVATGINNNGDIVLSWVDTSGNSESSLYNGKTYKTINVPGAVHSIARDINAAGDVIYQWLPDDFHSHGALLHDGKYYKFDCHNSMSTAGAGLNDNGLAVGSCQPVNNLERGFKATY